VTVLKNGVQTVTPVQVGLVGDAGTQITGGVSEGDVLVLPTTVTTSGTNGFPRLGGIGGLGGGRG
jgi:macrolide-specific efflux system membrane fusion protein